mgnify:CR=1 FL=1
MSRAQDVEKEELIDTFESVSFKAGTTVMKQGEKGETFYVIESGECEVLLDGHKKAIAVPSAGNSFGELALMYNTPRAATVVAKSEVVCCWKIDRKEFRLVLAHHARIRSEHYKTLLKEVRLRCSKNQKERMLSEILNDAELTKLADCMDEE